MMQSKASLALADRLDRFVSPQSQEIVLENSVCSQAQYRALAPIAGSYPVRRRAIAGMERSNFDLKTYGCVDNERTAT
jgi:hypothetical protein